VSKLKLAATSVETRPGDDFQNLASERNKQPVNKLFGHLLVRSSTGDSLFGGVLDKITVRGHLSRLIEKRRVSGGVLRTMTSNRFNVTGIRYDGRVLLKAFS
jgi:hypothetical protein